MPGVGGLDVQVNQGLNQNLTQGLGQGLPGAAGTAGPSQAGQAALHRGIRSGTLVEGQVLAQNADGTYSVRVGAQGAAPQELRARATLSLIVGERFRAVWDASSGDVPTLRLSEGELSLLSQVPTRDRGIAAALLSRGLPLSGEALTAIRDAWRRMGAQEGQLSSLVELWARGAPLTAENAALLSEYAALDGEAASTLWNGVRKELKARLRRGEDPVRALRAMKEGEGGASRFLRAQSLLMRSPREGVDPALLSGALWPLSEGGDMTARVYVGRSAEEEGQRYWQVGFGLAGAVLGPVEGLVESDGRACNLSLAVGTEEARGLLEAHRGELRAELEGSPLPVQFIGITQRAEGSGYPLAGRGLDVTV